LDASSFLLSISLTSLIITPQSPLAPILKLASEAVNPVISSKALINYQAVLESLIPPAAFNPL